MASDDVLRKNRGLGFLLSTMGVNKEREALDNGLTSQGAAGDGAAGTSRTQQDNQSGQGMSGNTPAEGQKEGIKFTKEFQDEEVYGPKGLNTWADLKEYNDDDYDSEWFDVENAKLAKKYGGDFITAKYLDAQPGKVGYFCQLCFAEMNAKKSLDLHCSGMKHLKRKDQWEKSGKGQEAEKSTRELQWRPPRPARREWQMEQPYEERRSQAEPRPYGRSSSPNYRRDDRSHYNRRDGYDRYPDNYYDDYHRNNPGPYRAPYDRVPYDSRIDQPDLREELDRRYPPARRDHGDRPTRDRYSPYPRREAPPPPVISSTLEVQKGKSSHPDPSAVLFEGITDGSCGELLKKLAACRVKSKDDTALASNVARYLIISLKEYYHKTGPPTIKHVLDEIILKFDIMKDLQK